MFRRRRFFAGDPGHGGESELGEIAWFTPAAEHMDESDWSAGHARAVAVWLNGEGISEPDPRGERIVDDSFLILFNSNHEPVDFTLPGKEYGESWEVVVDTTEAVPDLESTHEARSPVTVAARSTMVLRRPKPGRALA